MRHRRKNCCSCGLCRQVHRKRLHFGTKAFEAVLDMILTRCVTGRARQKSIALPTTLTTASVWLECVFQLHELAAVKSCNADLLCRPAIFWYTSLNPDELYNCNQGYESIAGSKANEGTILPVWVVINALPPGRKAVQSCLQSPHPVVNDDDSGRNLQQCLSREPTTLHHVWMSMSCMVTGADL